MVRIRRPIPACAALRPVRSAILAVAMGLALSACAETEFLVHTAKQVEPYSSARPPTVEGYKVGQPYQIAGIWYYPAEDFDYSETGIASWYGPGFHGKTTANGETYDQNALTAAHPTLPMPTIVRVTNLENGRAMMLRINDRGPFARGRIIDVSRRAAQLLGFERNGTAKVRVEVMAEESRQLKLAALNRADNRAAQVQVAASPREGVTARSLPPAQGQGAPTAIPAASGAPVASQPLPPARSPEISTRVEVLPVSPTGIYVQAGAFAQLENALRMRDRVYNLGPTQISRFAVSGTEVYRVRIGPLNTVEVADVTLARVIDNGVDGARLVVE